MNIPASIPLRRAAVSSSLQTKPDVAVFDIVVGTRGINHRLHSSRLIGVRNASLSRAVSGALWFSACGFLPIAAQAQDAPTSATENVNSGVAGESAAPVAENAVPIEEAAQSDAPTNAAAFPVITLPLEKTLELPFGATSTYTIDSGVTAVRVRPRRENGSDQVWLSVEPLKSGQAQITTRKADGTPRSFVINIVGAAPASASTSTPAPFVAPVPAATVAEPLPEPMAPVLAPPDSRPLPSLNNRDNRSLPSGLNASLPAMDEPQISPILPQPRRSTQGPLPAGRASFPAPTVAQQRRAAAARQAVAARRNSTNSRVIKVTQGLARFLSFRQNILTVFYSDINVMDARAMNARTVAVTGSLPGRSTLAVFVAQSPTDVVGRAEIFNIVVESPTPNNVPVAPGDAPTLELAIRSALNDPRVAVHVIRQPNGAFAASLSGTLRNEAEISAARSTAALFVPAGQVISSLYASPDAPSLYQANNPVQYASGEQVLQNKLRQITGNDSIELITLPTGLAAKAEVGSREEAEALLRLLPTLNTRVLPFIVIRGANNSSASGSADASEGGKYYGADRAVLQGEDQEITRRLHEVTGVNTVYAVRTAQNAIAIYGTARNRIEYDTVRRYAASQLPLLGAGVPATAAGVRSTGPGSLVPVAGGATGVPASGGSVGRATGANGNALVSPRFNPANAIYNPKYSQSAQISPGTTGASPGAAGIGGGLGAGGNTGAVAPTAPSDGFGGANSGTGIGTTSGTGLNNGFPVAAGAVPFGAPTGNYGVPIGNGDVYQIGGGVAAGGAQAAGYVSNPDTLLGTNNQAQQPSTGYRQPINVQMFVRVLDGTGQQIRRVTAETSIVEISRTALRNLGVEVGTATLLSQTTTAGTPATGPTIVTNPNGGQTITPGNPGTPGTVNSTIDPAFRPGVLTGAAGFAGGQALQLLDPLRARLNAVYQNGNARILSRPNITAVEGAQAQIVVGGERPVPSAVSTGQAVGQSIVFRRFGIILTMRPTLTDDDTIILQIRADITELANEFGINLNGALIPGERVRSVNTTMNVREGDTIVLGGLITNDRREQTSRVPILSSIPILGQLFKSRRFEQNESELAIFMTPRILRSDASVNTLESIKRVPGLPDLPDSNGAAAFGALGTAVTR